MGKCSDRWPEDLRPYAIRSLREVTPDDLLGSSLPSDRENAEELMFGDLA